MNFALPHIATGAHFVLLGLVAMATARVPAEGLDARSLPAITQTVGTFQYMGCFQDQVGTEFHSLATLGLGTVGAVSTDVTLETCTAACKAQGFALAGVEFGDQCWCDTYMVIVTPAADADCSTPCTADPDELCGGSNRIAVYQDTSATPPNSQQCLTNFQIPFLTVTLNWVPTPGGGPASQLTLDTIAATGISEFVQQILVTIGTNTPAVPGGPPTLDPNGNVVANEFIIGGGLGTIQAMPVTAFTNQLNFNIFVVSLAPTVGGPQLFKTEPRGTPMPLPSNQYCAQPNPVGLFGPFIGPPVLAVNGRSDQWALCPNNTALRLGFEFGSWLVYAPISSSPDYVLVECQSVVIQMELGIGSQ